MEKFTTAWLARQLLDPKKAGGRLAAELDRIITGPVCSVGVVSNGTLNYINRGNAANEELEAEFQKLIHQLDGKDDPVINNDAPGMALYALRTPAGSGNVLDAVLLSGPAEAARTALVTIQEVIKEAESILEERKAEEEEGPECQEL